MFKDNIINGCNGMEYSYQDFLKEIKNLKKLGYNMYIGTDSQVLKDKVSVVTCVCPYLNGKGGRIFYVKKKFNRSKFPTIRMRLLFEAYKSIKTAMELEESIICPITIHLDIGSDIIKCKSSKWKNELETLVSSQGYGCKIKPYSWASSVADRFTKS